MSNTIALEALKAILKANERMHNGSKVKSWGGFQNGDGEDAGTRFQAAIDDARAAIAALEAEPQDGDVVAPKPTQERNENFVPGVMHCAKCRFRLNRINLNVNVGTVTAGDNKTEPCPNGCGPLWPITWEQEAREGYAALEAMFERAYAAEQALAARPSSPVLQLVASKSGTKQGQDAAPAEQDTGDCGFSACITCAQARAKE